jgi:nitrite reductase/ring-hydroxylating ferredoxin subunit
VPEPSLSRRRVVAGAAVGGLSLPLLAACGGQSGSGTAQSGQSAAGGAPPSSGGDPQSGGAAVLVPAAKVPVGGGVILRTQNVVVTQPSKGTFEGFSATCTHMGCQLATVAGGTINCGCHGSQFAITDGSNVTGPLGEPAGSVPPLPKVPVRAKGPNIVMR